ncbi:hypothetical protein KSS87_021739 [Heliosperma pusillum]|nr:hypothetical protein KSS87_021739 [Heliosperma pusillum]
MGDQHSGEGAGPSDAASSNTYSTLVLNIKTLDSRIYTFQVEKNVSCFWPIRLEFRNIQKPTEDVENGDTLHLVERQPTQEQPSSGTDASSNIGSQGNDASAGIPRNRIGQISHSVVLGTFNMGDQGEAAGSELTRVIGAVLNSLGVGNQGMAHGAVGTTNSASTNVPGPAPQASNVEQERNRSGAPSQAQSPIGQSFFSQAFTVPLVGASIPPPSVNQPIPDSLNTLSEFMSRMEEVLSQNGYEAPPSTTSVAEQLPSRLSSAAQRLPTPEALSIVLRHAQRLLTGHAASAVSHIAGQLEQEAGSTDASVRSQIQSESVQLGLAMQHLGALFLELGRTILMLRMGNSPAEAIINSGHAVYISPLGPNPIMVQPFPHQISPLFNAPAPSASNSGTSIPVGIVGNAPRNINIHIHAGASVPPIVSPLVARAAGGEGISGERSGPAALGDPGASRVFPVRNVIATAVPSRSATIAIAPATSTSQPIGGVATSQSPELAAMVSEVNSQIRNFIEHMRADNQTRSGPHEGSVTPNSSLVSGGVDATGNPSNRIQSESNAEASELRGFFPEPQSQNGQRSDPFKSNEESSTAGEPSVSCVSKEFPQNSESNQKDLVSSGITQAPLGLGGGLQPKKRGQQSNLQRRRGEGETSTGAEQSQVARVNGQQILQSLLSQSALGRTANPPISATQNVQGREQSLENVQSAAQASDGQLDVTGMMSQLLDSPALNGLLSGVAQQTGVGSPNVLRNMIQQFTQNPAMRNTVNQLAQQVDREDLSSMFAGTGAGQGGNLDLSRMFQQMMPVVSQMLGSVSVDNEQVHNLVPELPPQAGISRDDGSLDQVSQSDIQEVLRQFAAHRSSEDIFHALAQIASEVSGTSMQEIVEWFSSNVELANLDMTCQEIKECSYEGMKRMKGGASPKGECRVVIFGGESAEMKVVGVAAGGSGWREGRVVWLILLVWLFPSVPVVRMCVGEEFRNQRAFQGECNPYRGLKLQCSLASSTIRAWSKGHTSINNHSEILRDENSEIRDRLKQGFPCQLIGGRNECSTNRIKVNAAWKASLEVAIGWVAFKEDSDLLYQNALSIRPESSLQAEAYGIRENTLANNYVHVDILSDCLQAIIEIVGVGKPYH